MKIQNGFIIARCLQATWLASLLIILLIFTPSVKVQQNRDPAPVVLDFRCPTYALSAASPIILRAEVLGAKELLDYETRNRIGFTWTLSRGRIISGQGTGKMVLSPNVKADIDVSCIEVKLAVEGGPPEMERERNCILRVDSKCAAPELLDQYGGLSVREEHQHLDHFAKYMKDAGPESIAYIISYTGPSACIYEAQWRADRAKKYLVEKHSVEDKRVVIVDGSS